ncbi:MAG TPA: PQQ-binding-like beta-propeller repeat protein, partial [Gemmataceae bacterium]|nr:PQQ-binding-like beta-propeller repeat protein [Gemmataceae bacterium]
MQQLQWGQPANFGKLDDGVRHNRLQAFDLATNGKLVWELGGRKIGDKDDPLMESYFLGPPLPVGDKLFVLNDKNSELRLICLDPPKEEKQPPSIYWIQSLVNLRDKMLLDVGRRIHAAHLSYGEGILVCPTNAGAILGVDLLSHTLAWAHSYREDNYQPIEENKKIRAGGGQVIPNYAKLNLDWKTSAPIIQEGKVVFTAPDSTSVQCLNLRNGDLLWKESRGDDLYLAGVYNGKVLLVGRSTCRALNLADGRPLWKVETGMPSGQGVASGNIYFLPLKTGAQSKEPEVCSIDLDKGLILAHTKSRKKEVPGNLLFYEGDVISQTATNITAYRQLRIKLEEIDLALKKNPKDPIGLTERGELRLDDGRLEDAVADLRMALANHPPAEIMPKTRVKLFETLTELFQRDFNASEKYLDEYRDMCKVEIPAGASDQERRRLEEEHQRRQGNLLCLVAKGREKQGRLGEAFDAYLEFGSLAGNHELVSVMDEPTIKARPDIWAQGRVAAMVSRATPDQRKPLEEKIARQWETIRESKDLNALRRFVALFGSLFAVGQEARMRLAERLIEDNAFLEAELHLLQLRHQPQKEQSAQAVEGLARLMIRKGLLDDAAYWYRVLGRDFAQTVVSGNKTGYDYLQDLATDKRLLAYLDEPRQSWAGVKWKAKEDYRNNSNIQQHVFEPEGEMLPFFQRHRLILQNTSHIKMVDRNTNEDRFSEPIMRNNSFNNLYNSGYNNVRFPYFFKGHLVVVNLGHVVYAFDPVEKKKLWEKNLMGNGILPGTNFQITQDRDGTLQLTYADGFVQKVGKTGPIEASYVCVNTRDGLVALDPLKGTVLWTKTDVPMRTQIFGDDQYVYLVEVHQDGSSGAGKALRAHDGVAVDVPDFGPLYSRRIRTIGRHLLLSETEKNDLVVRLYDVHTGKDVWKKSFPAKAIVLKCEDPDLVGAVDPKDGKVTVFNLHNKKEVLAATVDPKDVEKVQEIYLLNDNDRFFLAIHRIPDPGLNPWGGPWANVIYGMRCVPVNGKVYAFERDTGKLNWKVDAQNQMMVLEQFKDMPIVLFTARSQKPQNVGGINRGGVIQVATTLSFDKRTGKRIFDKEFQNQSNQFYALNVNMQAGT